ncbi:zinc finger protein 507 isoform X2 [Hippocampus zosterae]|uniref:zinc finger protein 507 isoform X2 n=1 Tax=Hippocampus zosterae TaxID=109293 RepID=UPI00223D1CD7|nr:zinc finger protein 507 isoform X2 [Hippocampus zosterae]
MEDINSVAVLIAAAAASSSAPSSEPHEQQQQRQQQQRQQQRVADASECKPDTDSLIQVIEKLSQIVEKRPQRRCTLTGHKRFQPRAEGDSPHKKPSVALADDGDHNNNNNNNHANHRGELKPAVTCYQCSLCPYLSPALPLLKEHLKQHNEHNQDLILMCSECCFSSRDQAQLEEHVRMHLDNGADATEAERGPGRDAEALGSECVGDAQRQRQEKKKKWYIYEEYGLYRCLICSYVCSQQRMLKTHAWKHAGLLDCSYPVFEEEEEEEEEEVEETGATSVVVASAGQEAESKTVSTAFKALRDCRSSPPHLSKEEPGEFAVKDLSPEESETELHVATETEVEAETASTADSLLTSAQKIINSDPKSAGHINVIVERLPSAEGTAMAAAPLLLDPEADAGQSLLDVKEEKERARGGDSPPDENVPPAGRKRTHSESLRLHSLAAEVLVAMPMRTHELRPEAASVMERQDDVDGEPGFLRKTPEGTASTNNAGISSSLLTVIERLRERSDQNASDEDILKELQDNANAAPECIPGAPPPDGSLVDYEAGSERPYRCRLCRYSSGNKGYIKQHLRVHRQRQPYQCPICEHVAADSKDLETHMIHHCKSRTYQCKTCAQAFHYKSQLRSHERDHHSFVGVDAQALAAVDETVAAAEEAERAPDEGALQKTFKCDACNYTSATYVGVRNHRRIHNSDKPYRCCNCDFATTNMNSLKSHMRRHPQEHQAVQFLEQYRCSLCGYVCSHPPSLKSHMWKHAGDQNYNYEQVNKAINEAISQSSRAPVSAPTGPESLTACSQENAKIPAEPPLEPPSALPKSNSEPSAPTPPRSSAVPPQPHGGGVEYCMLLFCCCICGLESTSKERLMEHMKEHEGDLISIILNSKDAHKHAQAGAANPE